MKRQIKTYIVDSFTNEPFKGNPAGVCLLDADLNDHTMASIAKELGLSETAFVTVNDKASYGIQYFSPKMEIPLCGHATLAASKVLFDLHPEYSNLQFTTNKNLKLEVAKEGEEMAMRFPVYSTEPSETSSKLVQALGISKVVEAAYNKENNILLLEIEGTEELSQLSPDFGELTQSHEGINGVVVTAPSKRQGFDFESRYFWPWSGTLEDPVTGGTHTFLAPYWAGKLGKKELHSFQCSERTGSMTVTIEDEKWLSIRGSAVVFLEGSCEI